ncbi:unnamed protein product, partial [Amoebophrya sp. A25]
HDGAGAKHAATSSATTHKRPQSACAMTKQPHRKGNVSASLQAATSSSSSTHTSMQKADALLSRLDLCVSKTLEFALSPRRAWKPLQDWNSNVVDVVNTNSSMNNALHVHDHQLQEVSLSVVEDSAASNGRHASPRATSQDPPTSASQLQNKSNYKPSQHGSQSQTSKKRSMIDERFRLTGVVDLKKVPANLRSRPEWDSQPLVPMSKYSRGDPWS